jgi:hypothetical protein
MKRNVLLGLPICASGPEAADHSFGGTAPKPGFIAALR